MGALPAILYTAAVSPVGGGGAAEAQEPVPEDDATQVRPSRVEAWPGGLPLSDSGLGSAQLVADASAACAAARLLMEQEQELEAQGGSA